MGPSWLVVLLGLSCALLVEGFTIATKELAKEATEEEAKAFLEEYNLQYGLLLNEATIAQWAYDTNITDYNDEIAQNAWFKTSTYNDEAFAIADAFDTTGFSEDTKRQLKKVGSRSLNDTESTELSQAISAMGKIYGSTKVGRANKPHYVKYVELKNKQAVLNDHDDLGDEWRDRYETDDFANDVVQLYKDMEPLYLELHAYIRRKLFETYGEDKIDLLGPLPAHLLGDMWGRFWGNLYTMAVPFPDKPQIVPNEEMKKQNYTVQKMFETGNNFYTSLGMYSVPDTFWNMSMLEKPDDGRANSFEDLQTIHHELGHIQYQQNYKHQPQVYRDGANDGFHEAIGELMSLVSSTPSYLSKIGLLPGYEPDEEQDLNFLVSQSLVTVSTLPFHLVYDLWRWNIFSGKVNESEWNNEFWRLKLELVGVAPAVDRSDVENLDGTALFHINQDYDMIRYFVRTILQFQFLESLCEESGHTGPLYRCDFSGSEAAGSKLAKMLELGSSLPWEEVLKELTGTDKMSTRPILQFFEPLHTWLQEQNAMNGDVIGWEGRKEF